MTPGERICRPDPGGEGSARITKTSPVPSGTSEDRRMRLAELAEYLQNREAVLLAIQYEERLPLYTPHQCLYCRLGRSRGTGCASCWREALKELEEK